MIPGFFCVSGDVVSGSMIYRSRRATAAPVLAEGKDSGDENPLAASHLPGIAPPSNRFPSGGDARNEHPDCRCALNVSRSGRSEGQPLIPGNMAEPERAANAADFGTARPIDEGIRPERARTCDRLFLMVKE